MEVKFCRTQKPIDKDIRIVKHFAFIPTKCEIVDPKTGHTINQFITIWLEKYHTRQVYFAQDNYWFGRYKPLVYSDEL